MIASLEQLREDLYEKIIQDEKDIDGLTEIIRNLTCDGKEISDNATTHCCISYYRKFDSYHEKIKLYIDWFGDDEGIEKKYQDNLKTFERFDSHYEYIAQFMENRELIFYTSP